MSSPSHTYSLLSPNKHGKYDVPRVVHMLWHAFTFLARYTMRGVTFLALRFISIGAEAFKWFEAASGVMGAQRGAICWADVRGAARVGEWNGCAAACCLPLELRLLTIAARLFGVEMQHPGVEKDVTVLWCRSASERDVSATAAPGMSNPADAAAAGRACRHKQLLSAPIDAASVRDPSAAVLLVPLSHAR